VSEDAQKRLIAILASMIASVLASRLSAKLIDVPEERGVKDDIKEALLRAGFSVTATLVASFVIRDVISKRWRW
jgi:hypothetical protein